MRKTLIVLMTVLLAGCVDDSASYYIDGRDHALTLRRQQGYFWKDEAAVSLVASHLPECQRLHRLTTTEASGDLKGEVFSAGDGNWYLRLGGQLWQVETNTCNSLTELENDPKADLGQPVGSFVVVDGKLVFEALPAQAAPAQ
ncbi:hypothetical protein [Janthinobacterium fluminis]|uniref:Lipoprotein n=1 Tax=Janthinobacterium fluminis TaxID=2987524 RepID=A0ABT5JZE7_9BURK|nr:hypothetical protein [Janthinobacterium fluminis]MDC8758107.1 hypothetical protein [Janthinobacterium fluminis]